MELIPCLPEEIGLECLLRLPSPSHRHARWVCRRWKNLIDDPDFYCLRKRYGNTTKVACLVQSLPSEERQDKSPVPAMATAYGVSVFDPIRNSWERLKPIPEYPTSLPLFCQLGSVEGELLVLGGWDPTTWQPVKDVWIYRFATGQWRRGKEMPVVRSFFAAAGAADGRVYVAGGHDEGKNALRSAMVYDVKRDVWEEVDEMGEGRDECEGVVVGGEFWVVSGYGTEGQGRFVGSVEAYDMAIGRWRRLEGGWKEGRCPRGCAAAGFGKEGRVICWAEEDPAVRVGTCGVEMGERVLLVGSVWPGAPLGFYLMDFGGGRKGRSRLERISVPRDFSGFVQSGCCVQI